MSEASAAPLLEIRDLHISFPAEQGLLPAVRQVNLALPPASVTCLVGESGCGKSLTARAVMRLTPEHSLLQGQILLHGQDLLALSEKEMRRIRGRRMGMIFQEPMTSLNPVLKVGLQVAEPLQLHWGLRKAEALREAARLLAEVGIPAAESRLDEYPHQLSGGLRQRVMIAMALACKPELLLADEPTTALDATIQGQILRLILEQSQERGMAVLLITHDLGVVEQVAQYVGVMYAGRLVERATATELFRQPCHPYTQGLMHSTPGRHSMREKRLPAILGSVPSLQEMPPACPFAPRCTQAMPRCNEAMPPLRGTPEHATACWLYAD